MPGHTQLLCDGPLLGLPQWLWGEARNTIPDCLMLGASPSIDIGLGGLCGGLDTGVALLLLHRATQSLSAEC